MKINWFSPLPPARSEIANYTALVLPALCKVAEVTVWTDQAAWDNGLESSARVMSCDWHQMPWLEVNKADVSIYNFGNDPLLHGSMWRISQCHAGVAILHDICLHDLFLGNYRHAQDGRDSYLKQMQRLHGSAGRKDGMAIWEGTANLTKNDIAKYYPLTKLALEKAIGVIVHDASALESIQSNNSWPVACLSLPSRPAASTVSPNAGEHPAKDYVSELMEFAREAIQFRRIRSFVNDQPARIGSIVGQLLSSRVNEEMLARISRELCKLGSE